MKILDDFGGLCQVASRMKAHENSWNPWHHVVDGFDSSRFLIHQEGPGWRSYSLAGGGMSYTSNFCCSGPQPSKCTHQAAPGVRLNHVKSCFIPMLRQPSTQLTVDFTFHHQLVPNEPWAVLCFQLQPRISSIPHLSEESPSYPSSKCWAMRCHGPKRFAKQK